MRKLRSLLLLAIICQGFTLSAQDRVKYVNTLQGTYSHWGLSYGSTYPTVGLPFAEHFFSAQTGKNGDGWKYQYQADKIRGFQQVHQCSPWMGDYAAFSLMPIEGELRPNEDKRASAFKHENEYAKPHYYSVKFDNGISAEMSPAERGAYMRFSFTGKDKAYLVFDGYTKACEVTVLPKERKIIGYVRNGTFIPGNFRNYFVIEFDQPFVSHGTWRDKGNTIHKDSSLVNGNGVGCYLEFKKGAKVQVKMASSYISPEQAALTLNREIDPLKNIDKTKAAAFKIWNDLLGRIEVEGGTEAEKETFYSCLFRSNLFSRKFYDLDANNKPYYFSPYDGKVHEGYMYTDNGFWDTFRTQFPLNNILHPEMQGKYMQSLLDAQQQSGWLPIWSNPGMSGVMVGNHAISLLADAWAKGVRNFDPRKALEAYMHEVTNRGPFGGANGRDGWKDYFTIGYVPVDEISESGARTLEFAYDDFCAYQLAKSIGDKFYEGVFAKQMNNYRNIFDPSVGFMRGRKRDGSWVPNFDPIEWGGAFTEGNSWQYSWSVFHDIKGLTGLMGGEQAVQAKLDTFFTTKSNFKPGSYKQEIHEMTEMVLAKMGQYAHGNQPCMHVAYIYNYLKQPWKTQYRVRAVMDQLYNAGPKGFPGDEDQGAMSSWYVISAMGLYSVTPGIDQYNLGSPVFNKTTISLENGKKFTIIANNNSKSNVYIQSATLNGKPYDHNFIYHADIMNGGTLVLNMSDKPNTSRGIRDEDRPFSISDSK